MDLKKILTILAIKDHLKNIILYLFDSGSSSPLLNYIVENKKFTSKEGTKQVWDT